MKFPRRHFIKPLKSTVAMHPEGLVILTAIRMTPATGVALLTVQIRFHAAAIPHLHSSNPLAQSDDLDAQFVTGNSRVRKEGHFTQIPAEIGTANSDAMDTDHRLTGRRCLRFININQPELARFFQLDGFHFKG
jgi:hypothetical protein